MEDEQACEELRDVYIELSVGEHLVRGTSVTFRDGLVTVQAGRETVAEYHAIGWRWGSIRKPVGFEEGFKDALIVSSQSGPQVLESYKRGQELGFELRRWRAVQTDIDNGHLKLVDLDKAIAVLEFPGGELETASPEFASERWDALDGFLRRAGAARWRGGECPVKNGDNVEFLRRSGISCETNVAEGFNWSWSKLASRPGDIIAYRIIEAPADAERTEEDSPGTDQDRADQTKDEGTPVLDAGQPNNEAEVISYIISEGQSLQLHSDGTITPLVNGSASTTDAERIEDDRQGTLATEQTDKPFVDDTPSGSFARGIISEQEPSVSKLFGGIFGIRAKADA